MVPEIFIINHILNVDIKDENSICEGFDALWNAELDLLENFNLMRDYPDSRDFDNYDINNHLLDLDFMNKVKKLIKWCQENNVLIK